MTFPEQLKTTRAAMTNNQITHRLFSLLHPKTVAIILENIASHYGISSADAKAEVLDDEAESILDYLTGSVRTATSLQMKRLNLARTPPNTKPNNSNAMTKFIRITISKTGKTLYYRGDGLWFGRCSEAFAKQKMAEGIPLWDINIAPTLGAGIIARRTLQNTKPPAP